MNILWRTCRLTSRAMYWYTALYVCNYYYY